MLKLLGRDMFLYGIMSGISRSGQLLLLPIFTHIFSSEEYGVIDVISILTSTISIFISFSLDSSVARYWYAVKEERRIFVSTNLIMVCLFGGAAVFIVSLFSGKISSVVLGDYSLGDYVVLASIAAYLTALQGISQIVLRMQRKIMSYNILLLIHFSLHIILTLWFVLHLDAGLLGVFVANIIALSISFLFGLLFIRSYLELSFSLKHAVISLKFSGPMVPSVFLGWVNRQVDRMMLLAIVGMSAVGVFGAAAKIAMIIGFIVFIFQQAWLAISMKVIDNDKDRRIIYSRVMNYYILVMIPIAMVIVVFSKDMLVGLTSHDYKHGFVVIPWLIGAQILYGSSSIANLGMLLTNKTFGNSVAAGVGLVVNLGLSYILISIMGFSGAGISLFIAEIIFVSVLYARTVHFSDIRFDTAKILASIALYALFSVIVISIDGLGESGYFSSASSRLAFLFAALIIFILTFWRVSSSKKEPKR